MLFFLLGDVGVQIDSGAILEVLARSGCDVNRSQCDLNFSLNGAWSCFVCDGKRSLLCFGAGYHRPEPLVPRTHLPLSWRHLD